MSKRESIKIIVTVTVTATTIVTATLIIAFTMGTIAARIC